MPRRRVDRITIKKDKEISSKVILRVVIRKRR